MFVIIQQAKSQVWRNYSQKKNANNAVKFNLSVLNCLSKFKFKLLNNLYIYN